VRILVGAGGVGKTRLALEIAAEWQAGGGVWRLAAAGQEAHAVGTARAVTAGRVLLVVDYAEIRAGLDQLLSAVAEDPGPIRVLLVARSLGEWWDRLIEGSVPAVAQLLTEAPPIQLDMPIAEGVSDADLAQAAVPYFARALSVQVPGRVEVDRAARRAPVLVLHAAALAAVLRFSAYPVASLRVVVDDAVLDELLEHESRYWRRAARAAGLPGAEPLVKPVVAAAALVGARSVAEAAAVVERVPELAGSPQERLMDWARWLYVLYPAGGGGRLGPVQPGLLAEAHVVGQLAADPVLARSCLRELSAEQAEQALTVLARACAHQDRARHVIAAALRDDLPHLSLAAARVAQQTAGELGGLLADALSDAPAAQQVLADIALDLPYPSVALAQAQLIATLRARESLPPDAEPGTRAEWDDMAGLALAQLGDRGDALASRQEGAGSRGAPTATSLGRYLPDIARSLTDLGTRFSELDRPDDALRAEQEAVTIRRELAAANPDRYRPDLASCLTDLGVRFSELGRPDDALRAEQEAVTIYRELAAANPDRYRPDLASCLANLGVWCSELGLPAEAVPPTREAVSCFRALAAANPDPYRPDLATSLTNLGIWFSELDRPEDALRAEQEAVTIRRELAAANPDRYRPDLARSLTNLGIWSSRAGHCDDALRAEQEAVTIRRELAAANPERHRPDLATSLTNLGITFSELGHPADALPPTKEAVIIYRELAAASPDLYRPDLARSLTNLGTRYCELGRPAAALPPAQEAVTIRRELAAANPDRYRPGLARSLTNLGSRLSALGRPAAALPAEQEAVTTYRELAGADPDRYRPDLARSLASLAAALSALGQVAEAADARGEAAAITRELEDPSAAATQ
jgi:tetratricopeptide (TPR) repeat protein